MADSSLNYLYTIGGYATLFGVGYVIYHVSTQKAKKRAPQVKPVKQSQPEVRKEDRKKKQRLESFASDGGDGAPSSQKPKSTIPANDNRTWANVASVPESQDDGNDKEFAKQLAKAREGTKFANKAENGKQREKSVKQSHANKIEGLGDVKASPPSSTAGIDADDDQSPAASPEAAPADAAGVADMLEPVPKGPSILRLTSTESTKQKPKVAKAEQPVETKKQRQNRKKAEAAKAARQDAEQERKVLEEKQRRTARIAEGRAAKDGSKFMAVNGNKSAWNQEAPNGASGKNGESSALYAPLDTFERPAEGDAKGSSTGSHSDNAWMSSLPSEEEQIEMLKDDADEWNTVKTKSSKKTKGSAAEAKAEPQQSRPTALPKQGSSSGPSKSFGSFSALTTKDDPAETAEEEWDV